jgi:hypothetical protein
MSGYAHVRNGSFSTELGRPRHVWFTPDSNRPADIASGPVRATTGLVHRSKLDAGQPLKGCGELPFARPRQYDLELSEKS